MKIEKFQEIPLEDLRLDPENPRLSRDEDWSSKPEEHLLREFYQNYNLVELAYSIATKGFLPKHAEALLVIGVCNVPNQYIVVEGNRRLATLKLLTNKEFRHQVGTSPRWEELAKTAADKDLDSIPVVIYENREDLDDYLGFRHITGPTPWRPEAKARFIARLLESGESIGSVARRIGSNHRTVRRYAEAHAVYSQALDAELPINQVEAAFGVFYNALDQIGIRDFLGLKKQSDIESLPKDPIPGECLENLEELIGLLYGDETNNLRKVIGESRELKILGEVLGDERGRRNIIMDRDLHRAWRLIGGGREDLLALLESAYSRLAEANGQAKEYENDEAVRDQVLSIATLVGDMSERYHVELS